MRIICKIFGHKWEKKRLPKLLKVKRMAEEGIFVEAITFDGVGYEDQPSLCCFRCGSISKSL